MKFSIRLLYLYLFSFIGLLISVIGLIQLTDLFIKIYVFKGADRYEMTYPSRLNPDGTEISMSDEEIAKQKVSQEEETKRQRQRQVSNSLAMIIIGLPLYKYHWNLISNESGSKK